MLGDQTLRAIDWELVDTAIDWTAMVKRILQTCGYPSDKQEKVTLTVLE